MIGTLEMAMNPLQPNDRITYSYERKQEGKRKAVARKRGVFVRKVRHPRKYWSIFHHKQMAVVKFDGNENETRVRYDQLKREQR